MFKKQIWKLLLMGAIAAQLGGCASIASDLLKSAWTPNIERCEGLEGKKMSEFREKLGFSDMEPESVRRDPSGEKIYIFQKGHLFAQVSIKNDLITEVECWRGPNPVAPSKRTMFGLPARTN